MIVTIVMITIVITLSSLCLLILYDNDNHNNNGKNDKCHDNSNDHGALSEDLKNNFLFYLTKLC